MMIKDLPEEHKAVVLLFINGLGETAKKLTTTDVLTALLTVAQIGVAIGTALWFFRKARSVQLDNKEKEQKQHAKKSHHRD